MGLRLAVLADGEVALQQMLDVVEPLKGVQPIAVYSGEAGSGSVDATRSAWRRAPTAHDAATAVGVDAVIVIGAASWAAGAVEGAVSQGRHVLCSPELILDEQLHQIESAHSADREVAVAVACQLRFEPSVLLLVERVERGDFGAVRHVRFEMSPSAGEPSWLDASWLDDRRAVLEAVDVIGLLSGDLATSTCVRTGLTVARLLDADGVERAAFVESNDQISTSRIEITGSEGSAVAAVGASAPVALVASSVEWPRIPGEAQLRLETEWARARRARLVDAFVADVVVARSGGLPSPPRVARFGDALVARELARTLWD